METGTWLMASLFFSSIGMGYFVYGKKQHRPVPLISGLLLFVYPYFVTNTILFFGLGILIAVLPYFIRL